MGKIIKTLQKFRILANLSGFFFLAWAGFAQNSPAIKTQTLAEVRQINQDGFGGQANKYAFSMAVYKDALYVGTLNLKTFPDMIHFATITSTEGDSQGAQIWKYTPGQGWKQVVKAGLGNPHNYGVRNLKVIDGCLYGVTANHDEGMEVWRTCDGEKWEQVAIGGFGNKSNTSGRGLGYFQGWIYLGVENFKTGAEIWRSQDGEHWERVAEKGIDTKNNVRVSDFVIFKDYLYLGTMNIFGARLYRTRDGINYQSLAKKGLEKKTNAMIMRLYLFKDKLFFSTADMFRGFDLYVSEDGVNFRRVLKNGFNNFHNAYIWQMQEYKGRLYAGTYYHRGLLLPKGSFMLFSSQDGENWVVETDNGFGNPWHYGIRTMARYRGGLVIGTASARYGCKVFLAR